MSQTKEAIELLKIAHYQVGMNTARCFIDQALTKLREPKCKTCSDTGKVPKPMPKTPHPCNYVNLKRAERTIPCPDCQQPPASNFTKEIRKAYNPEDVPITYENACTDIFDLCARLDRSEANRKELVKYATHDPDCHKISRIGVDNDCTCGFEAAIAKEKGIKK